MSHRLTDIGLTRQHILWCWLIILVVKLGFVYVFAQMSIAREPVREIGAISFASGDDFSYTGAMDNYIEHGQYYFINQLGDTIRVGRAPHYAAPYWLARQVTDRATAGNFVTLLNVLLDSFAIVCMAIMVFVFCSRRKFAFYSALLLGGISTYVSNWTYVTTPDAPAAALLMIAFFYSWRAFLEDNHKKLTLYLFLSSCFFSWAIVLRPYLSIILIVMAIIFLWRKRNIYKILPRLALVCSLPFIIMISPWVIRNFTHFGKIIPFQQDIYAGYGYRPAELQIRKMINSLGDDGGTFWDPYSMASYFSPVAYRTSQFNYPEYLQNDTTLYNRIEKLRGVYLDSTRNNLTGNEESMREEALKIKKDYIRKYTFRYYFLNPLKRTAIFWGHSGAYYLPPPKQSNFLYYGYKISQSLLYFAVLALGTFGLVLLSRKTDFAWILLLPIIILTIFFPVLFAFMEPRYAIGFYYPGLIGLVYLMHLLTKRYMRRGNTTEIQS